MTKIQSHKLLSKTLLLGSAISVLGCLALPAASQTPTPLPYPEGSSTSVIEMNNNRTILGTTRDELGRETALIWQGGSYTKLEVPDLPYTAAFAINDSDVSVGVAYGGKDPWAVPVKWEGGQAVLLPTLGCGGFAVDINAAGDIIGAVCKTGDGSNTYLPAVWRSGQLQLLTSDDYQFDPQQIDDNGTIYGTASLNGSEGVVTAALSDGQLTVLPATYGANYLGRSRIFGAAPGFLTSDIIELTASGTAVNNFAVAWENGIFRRLELPEGQTQSSVSDVNRNGVYAGSVKNDKGEYSPVLWSKDGPNLLQKAEGTSVQAAAINDTGFVVGTDVTNPSLSVPVFWDLSDQVEVNLSDVTAVAGQTVPLRATATLKGAPQRNLKMTFSVDGKAVGDAITNSKGVATFNYTVPMRTSGVITASAKPASARKAAGATAVRSIIVGKSPSVAAMTPIIGRRGAKVDVVANLRLGIQNTALAGKSLSFFINGKNVGKATTDKFGVARTSITLNADPSAGNLLPVEVRYAGDTQSRSSVGRVSAYIAK